jgi:hypothetical protein
MILGYVFGLSENIVDRSLTAQGQKYSGFLKEIICLELLSSNILKMYFHNGYKVYSELSWALPKIDMQTGLDISHETVSFLLF